MSSHPHIVPTRMNWSLRAEDIKKAATDLIARSKHVMDEVANARETTWEAVMKPLAGASAHRHLRQLFYTTCTRHITEERVEHCV